MKMLSLLRAAVLTAACTVAMHAQAHSHPVSEAPAADALVAAPTEVAIVFSEALEPAFSTLAVSDARGKPVTSAKAELDTAATGKRLRLAMPPLAPGIYEVKWVAVAVDGHRSSGSYRFTVK